MASGEYADAPKLTPQDLKKPGEEELPGAPIVHVEGFEEDNQKSQGSPAKLSNEEAHHQTPTVTHETENLKTTVTVEEDLSPHTSTMDKMKGTVRQIGDKLTPQAVVHAQHEDPHPSLS